MVEFATVVGARRRPRWLTADLTPHWRLASGPARDALIRAEECARELWHTFLGTEHVLLGLLGANDGLGAALLGGGRPPSPGHPNGLRGLVLDAAAIRSRVEHLVGRGSSPSPADLLLTPRARQVLELAAEEMRRRGDPQIGSQHLLVGLLREGEGMGARILVEFGADLTAVLGRLEEFGEKDAASMSVDSAGVHVDRRWRRVWCGACSSVERLVVHLEPDGDAVGHHLDLLCGRCRSVVAVLHPAPAGQPE